MAGQSDSGGGSGQAGPTCLGAADRPGGIFTLHHSRSGVLPSYTKGLYMTKALAASRHE